MGTPPHVKDVVEAKHMQNILLVIYVNVWFGITIHQHSVYYQLKKAIGAILQCCIKINMIIVINFCPPDQPTKYQKDKLTGKTTHKDNINIPEWIFNIIKPIFELYLAMIY